MLKHFKRDVQSLDILISIIYFEIPTATAFIYRMPNEFLCQESILSK